MFGCIFGWNYATFYGIKKNTKYTYGEIIANFETGRHNHDYSRYEYKVDGLTHRGRQGDDYPKEKLVVIVYDMENPKYSMIAEYPLEIINEQKDTIKIEERFVDYSWWNYLPADNLSDLWSE